jgi:hypothetical protein
MLTAFSKTFFEMLLWIVAVVLLLIALIWHAKAPNFTIPGPPQVVLLFPKKFLGQNAEQ